MHTRAQRIGLAVSYLPYIWPWLVVAGIVLYPLVRMRKRMITKEIEKYWEKASMEAK